MADQKLDTEIRREQIAQAALDLVASQGVRRLSVAAVARRVGLVPSGIYRHFKNKAQMIDAVLDLLEKRLLGLVEAARQEAPGPLERLQAVLFRHIRFIREGRSFPQIIFSDEVHAGHPDRKQRAFEILSRYLAQIVQLIQEAQRQGLASQHVDPETAAMLFLGMVAPAGIRWHITDGGFDVTRHAQRVWPLFRAAIGAAPE